MSIQEFYSEKLKDKYYLLKHKSGLDIYICPKQDYNSSFAVFGTKYGSINRTFSIDNGEKITVPDGIAHYLEHKLFESEDIDAFKRFAETGANANAFTSFDKTCYLFSCSENLEQNLEILLDFVQSPFFTEETVQKEQGIIGQEIQMYDDEPSWRAMFNLFSGMYHNHPIKIDIAGTIESISHITADLLYKCYNTFYNLNNMALCVAGNVDVAMVERVADKVLKISNNHKITNYFDDEPETIVKDYIEQKFPIAVPVFNLGYKETPKKYTEKELIAIDILLAMIASSTSELYEQLMRENLINSSFSYEFSDGEGYACVIFSGESRFPQQVADKIRKYISDLHSKGLSVSDFETTRRAVYGDVISSFNSTTNIATNMIDFVFSGNDYYKYVDCISEVTFEDVCKCFKDLLHTDKSVLSVALPDEEHEER